MKSQGTPRTRFGTEGYRALRELFSMTSDSHDPFGSAMGMFFPVADRLWHSSAEEIPPEWQFGHGAGCHDEPDNEDLTKEELRELYDAGIVTDDDLLTFGTVMHRYISLCDMAGRSY